MSDIHTLIYWVWGTTWALIALALLIRGKTSFERIFQTETPMETWAFRVIMSLNMGAFFLHLVDVVDFAWFAISAFGIAGYASYRSLWLILFKAKSNAPKGQQHTSPGQRPG